MRKFLIPSIFLLLLLTISCKSTERKRTENEKLRAQNALIALAEDMIVEAIPLNFDSNELSSALPSSYSSYKDYIPRFNEYQKDYLDKVLDEIPNFLPEIVSMIRNEVGILSENPFNYINSDTSFTSKIKEDLEEHLKLHLGDLLLENPEALVKAFSASKNEFDGIREVYLNLGQLNKKIELPKAEEIDYDKVASIYIDKLFASFENTEKNIKSQKSNRHQENLYSIFWELSNE